MENRWPKHETRQATHTYNMVIGKRFSNPGRSWILIRVPSYTTHLLFASKSQRDLSNRLDRTAEMENGIRVSQTRPMFYLYSKTVSGQQT